MKNQIKADIKTAMKQNFPIERDILRVFLSEIERAEQTSKGKVELSELQIQTLAKKISSNIKETSNDQIELEILSRYFPGELTQVELEDIIDAYIVENDIENMKGMGRIMGYLSSTYPNRYDGKLASQLIREVLQ